MHITYEMYLKIHRLRAQGKYQWQIAEELGCSTATIKRYWHVSEDRFIHKPSKQGRGIMSLYRQRIVGYLEDDPNITNKEIYSRLLQEIIDYRASEKTTLEYLYELRKEEGFAYPERKRAKQKLPEREPAEEAQVDMGQITIMSIYGRRVKVYMWAMVLTYSRLMFCTFRTEPFTSLDFVEAHKLAFRYFGGRTQTITYDQDRVMVVSENAGDIVFTKEFEKFKEQEGFNIFLCHKSDPSTKGMIENTIRYIKYNFFKGKKFSNLINLNDDLAKWLDEVANVRIHGTTLKAPKDLYLVNEKEKLVQFVDRLDEPIKYRTAKITKVHTIKYQCNHYSVPKGRYEVGTTLKVACVAEMLKIYDVDTDELIVQHPILKGRGESSIIAEKRWQYEDLVKETLDSLNKTDCAMVLLENIKRNMPRYVREQCHMLKRIAKSYDSQTVEHAIKLAIEHNILDATHVLTILVNKEGVEKAKSKKVLPVRTAEYYKEKAKGLSAYDKLSKKDGGL